MVDAGGMHGVAGLSPPRRGAAGWPGRRAGQLMQQALVLPVDAAHLVVGEGEVLPAAGPPGLLLLLVMEEQFHHQLAV